MKTPEKLRAWLKRYGIVLGIALGWAVALIVPLPHWVRWVLAAPFLAFFAWAYFRRQRGDAQMRARFKWRAGAPIDDSISEPSRTEEARQ